MNQREQLLKMYRREGTGAVPVGMHFCPSLEEEFKRRYPGKTDYLAHFGAPYRIIHDPGFAWKKVTAMQTADGAMCECQQGGTAPERFDPNNNENYGTGAYLLFASGYLKMEGNKE